MLRTALIGTGYIAREHLRCLASLSGVEVVGVCDRSAALAEAASEEFGVPRWDTDVAALLRDLQPDVVHVTTPPASHRDLALAALDSGAHVFLEKPLAVDRAHVAELLDAAERRERWLIEDHNYRFSPAVQQILAWHEEGALGEVVHVDVVFAVAGLGAGSRLGDAAAPDSMVGLPGGAALDFVTHLSYLAQLFVGAARSVDTRWRKRGGSDAPWDELRVLVDGARGTASLGWSANAQPDRFALRVEGTRMRASASLFEPLLVAERLHDGPRPLVPVRNGLSTAWAYTRSAVGGLWRKLQDRPLTYQGLWTLLDRTYRSLATGAPPPITPDEIRESNQLVWEILAQEPGR